MTKFEGFLESDRIRDINYVDIDLGHNVHNISLPRKVEETNVALKLKNKLL